MKTFAMPPAVAACIEAVNARDLAKFSAVFREDCVVNDIGREHRGRAAIEAWAQKEIFAVNAGFEVLGVSEENGACVVRVKVDGTFDKTGLPDPLIFQQIYTVAGGRIAQWTCRIEQ